MSYRFTSVFIHAEPILTPCQKRLCYTYSKIRYPSLKPTIAVQCVLQQEWHIYIEGVGYLALLIDCIAVHEHHRDY